MKKLLCILPFFLLLCACSDTVNGSPDPHTAARAVIEACEEASFIRADTDFVSTNFQDLPRTEEAIIYCAENNDGTEIGLFFLSDREDISRTEALIREYIDSERRQATALASLYPGEELNARLARYDNAKVGHRGVLVFYVIGDQAFVQQTMKAL
jgi:hypothetical protein